MNKYDFQKLNQITKSFNHKIDTIIPLTGDASTRNYYRLKTVHESFVLMDTHNPIQIKSDDFILIQTFLKNNGICTPNVLFIDEFNGVLILEDLGDVQLQEMYEQNPQACLEELYPQAFDMIKNLQQLPIKGSGGFCPALNRCFDIPKFLSELEFFVIHFLEGHLKLDIKEGDRESLRYIFQNISELMVEYNQVFSHRDFHSRNLMVKNNRLFLIDFQDARLGISHYDLASFLRDAYVRLPEKYIENKLSENILLTDHPDHGLSAFNYFSVTCVQRNLKALGTFGFQATQRKNNSYLKFVPILLDHLQSELNKSNFHPLEDLKPILRKYLPLRLDH